MTRTPSLPDTPSIDLQINWIEVSGQYLTVTLWGAALYALVWFIGFDAVLYDQEWQLAAVGFDAGLGAVALLSLMVAAVAAPGPVWLHRRTTTVTVRGRRVTPLAYLGVTTAVAVVVTATFVMLSDPIDVSGVAVFHDLRTGGTPRSMVALLVDLGSVLLEVLAACLAFVLLVGANVAPTAAVGYLLHRRLDPDLSLAWRDRAVKAAAVTLAVLVVVAGGAVLVGAAGGPADTTGPASDTSPTPSGPSAIAHVGSTDNVTEGRFRSLPRSFTCADSPYAPWRVDSYPEYPAASTTHNSPRIQIAPLRWDRPGRSGHVNGWFALRVTGPNGTTPVSADRIIRAVAYRAPNTSGYAPVLMGSNQTYDSLAVTGRFYVVVDIADETGSVHRHTASYCPPDPEEGW